jgi:biopolymer transport protein ExbD
VLRFSRREQDINRLETAAMADIVFLLLIFFLLSSSFILPTEIPVTPPESEYGDTVDDQPIVVNLARTGDIFVDDEKVPSAELGTALAARLMRSASKAVIIRGDKSIELGRLVEVMDVAKKAGAEKLALATRQKPRG